MLKTSLIKYACILFLTFCLSPRNACSQGRSPDEESDKLISSAIHGEVRNGILFQNSDDDNFSWWLDGRIFMDAAWYFEDSIPLSNGTEVRKARLAIKTTLWKNWATEFDIGFEDNEVDIKDFWVGYYFNKQQTHIKIGNFKEPFGMEDPTSSRYFTFMERSYASQTISPSRHLGLALTHFNKYFWISAGIFGEEITNEKDKADEMEDDDEGYAFTSRFVSFPVKKEGLVLHLGIAASHRTADANGSDIRTLRLRCRPETHIEKNYFLNTGSISHIKSHFSYGLEAAFSYKFLRMQSEYMHMDVKRENGLEDLSFDGSYVLLAGILTGEHYHYWPSQAEFGRIIPQHKYGALEVAFRYSTMDLNNREALIMGGEAENLSFGINWYANASIRFMLNYSIVNNDRFANGNGEFIVTQGEKGEGGEDFSFLQVRLQALF